MLNLQQHSVAIYLQPFSRLTFHTRTGKIEHKTICQLPDMNKRTNFKKLQYSFIFVLQHFNNFFGSQSKKRKKIKPGSKNY